MFCAAFCFSSATVRLVNQAHWTNEDLGTDLSLPIDVSPTDDFKKLAIKFTQLWDWVTVLEETISTLHGREDGTRALAPHLSSTPMVLEANLTTQAARICSSSAHPIALDLIELANLRFLRWLATFVRQMNDVRSPPPPPGLVLPPSPH